ncbi:MAG: putative lipid II flippase FtsW [Methylocystaceae bacterium]
MNSRAKGPPDAALMFVVMALICIGLVMIFSSSAVTASQKFDDGAYHFIKRQFIWALAGFVIMLITMKIDLALIRRWAPAILGISVFFLLIVFVPGLGIDAKGATRQISLGGFINFMPSELSKLCLVIFLARYLADHINEIQEWWSGFIPPLLIAGGLCGLVMLGRDLGTTMVIAVTVGMLLFAAGGQMKHLILSGTAAVSALVAAIVLEPFRFKRIMAFWDPMKYADTTGFQIIQSLYALGSGGLFGVGLGRSRQKFFWLPEQYTDFIFAILGEELGFVGVALLLTLFFMFAWRGFRIALKAPDTFTSLLATGLTTMILFQALLNMGVVSGSLPVTGVPLPFISYGGSSLLLNMISVGILLNISRYASLK